MSELLTHAEVVEAGNSKEIVRGLVQVQNRELTRMEAIEPLDSTFNWAERAIDCIRGLRKQLDNVMSNLAGDEDE